MVKKNLEDFYYQAFVKWIFSLTNEEKIHILSFWSEYDYLEDTLNELNEQLNKYYKDLPFQYEQLYDKRVKNPAKHTFDSLQRVFSSISGKKPLKNPTIEKSIQRILASASNGRYKMAMIRLVDYQIFHSADPIFMFWIQSMMEIQQLPYDFILNEKFDFYSIEDLCEDLETQERLTQLEKEAKGSIENHPQFAEIYQENKMKNFLKQMSVDVIYNLDCEFLLDVLGKAPVTDYPKIVESIFTQIEVEMFSVATTLNIDEEVVMEHIFDDMIDYLEKLAKNMNLLVNYKKIKKEMLPIDRCIIFSRAIQSEARFYEFISELHSAILSAILVEFRKANGLDFDEKITDDYFSEHQMMIEWMLDELMTQTVYDAVSDLVDENIIDVKLIFED